MAASTSRTTASGPDCDGTPCNRRASGEDRPADAATNRDDNEAAGESHMIAPPRVSTPPGSRPPPRCALLRPERYIGYAPPWAQRAWQTRPGATLGMVRAVFASRCCGYAVRPSAEALARALRPDAPQPLTIGDPAVRAWLTEVSWGFQPTTGSSSVSRGLRVVRYTRRFSKVEAGRCALPAAGARGNGGSVSRPTPISTPWQTG